MLDRRIAEDHRRSRHIFGRDAHFGLEFGAVQQVLGKTDPASAQSFVVGRQHEVLRRQTGVSLRFRPFRFGINHDQDRRIVKNVERPFGQGAAIFLQCRMFVHPLQYDRFGAGRNLFQSGFVAKYGKHPGLGIHRAGRLGGQLNQFLNHFAFYWTRLVFAHRAPGFQSIYQIHFQTSFLNPTWRGDFYIL